MSYFRFTFKSLFTKKMKSVVVQANNNGTEKAEKNNAELHFKLDHFDECEKKENGDIKVFSTEKLKDNDPDILKYKKT